jgi:hypothetical protein
MTRVLKAVVATSKVVAQKLKGQVDTSHTMETERNTKEGYFIS